MGHNLTANIQRIPALFQEYVDNVFQKMDKNIFERLSSFLIFVFVRVPFLFISFRVFLLRYIRGFSVVTLLENRN